MMATSFRCDVCSSRSSSARGWIVMFVQNRVIRLAPWDYHRRAGARHICSAACAVHAVSLGLPATMEAA